jgi:hypothetical protein
MNKNYCAAISGFHSAGSELDHKVKEGNPDTPLYQMN